jgi:hypothetical protein
VYRERARHLARLGAVEELGEHSRFPPGCRDRDDPCVLLELRDRRRHRAIDPLGDGRAFPVGQPMRHLVEYQRADRESAARPRRAGNGLHDHERVRVGLADRQRILGVRLDALAEEPASADQLPDELQRQPSLLAVRRHDHDVAPLAGPEVVTKVAKGGVVGGDCRRHKALP